MPLRSYQHRIIFGAPSMNIFIYPELPTGSSRDDLLARLTWYLLPILQSGKQQVTIISRKALPKKINVPAYLDQTISQNYGAFRAACKTTRSIEKNFDLITKNDVTCICFDKGRIAEISDLGFTEIVSVDSVNERFESSKYLRAVSRDGLIPSDLLTEYKARFNEVRELCNGRPVGIFGTGPSLDDVTGSTFDKCFNIATNSMVVNEELLETLKPRVIVASDPIFHAGCASYAQDFREALVKAVKKFDAYFVFPARDYHIYEYYLKDIKDRLIGVPMIAGHATASARIIEKKPKLGRREIARTRKFINNDIHNNFHSVVTNNVMTFFLLPIAASLSEKAVGAGFDGRDPDADEYFWGHAKKSQINSKMDDISDAHPGFFDIDYNEYLREHTLTLERQLIQLDDEGFEFKLITHSHLPPLSSRLLEKSQINEFLEKQSAKDETASASASHPDVSIIMPNYNAGAYIYQAIASIVSQTWDSWELIIVDNGSTDVSLDWIKSLAVADDRINYIHNPVKGVSASRNVGIEAARGRYICFLDSDDELWAKSLELRINHADQHDASVVFGLAAFIDKNSSSLGHVTGARKDLSGSDFLTSCPVHTGTVMARSEIVKGLKFDESLSNGEDYLFFAKMARLGYRYKSLGSQRVGAYRIHQSSVTQADFHYHNRQLENVYGYLNTDVKGHPWYQGEEENPIPDGFFVNQTATRDIQSLIFLICKGEADKAKACVKMINDAANPKHSDFIDGYSEAKPTVTVDALETMAMRSHALPKKSAVLYREIIKNAELAIEISSSWENETDIRQFFAGRIKALYQRAGNAALGMKAAKLKLAPLFETASSTYLETSESASVRAPARTVTARRKKSPALAPQHRIVKRAQNLISANDLGSWSVNAETVSTKGKALHISRNGTAFSKNASFQFTDSYRNSTVKVKVTNLKNSLLVYHNQQIVRTIKSAGKYEIELVSLLKGDKLSFAVADGFEALAVITAINFKT